jgi:hypothetical protein
VGSGLVSQRLFGALGKGVGVGISSLVAKCAGAGWGVGSGTATGTVTPAGVARGVDLGFGVVDAAGAEVEPDIMFRRASSTAVWREADGVELEVGLEVEAGAPVEAGPPIKFWSASSTTACGGGGVGVTFAAGGNDWLSGHAGKPRSWVQLFADLSAFGVFNADDRPLKLGRIVFLSGITQPPG